MMEKKSLTEWLHNNWQYIPLVPVSDVEAVAALLKRFLGMEELRRRRQQEEEAEYGEDEVDSLDDSSDSADEADEQWPLRDLQNFL